MTLIPVQLIVVVVRLVTYACICCGLVSSTSDLFTAILQILFKETKMSYSRYMKVSRCDPNLIKMMLHTYVGGQSILY